MTTLRISPVVSALLRHRAGFILLASQVALTLAIVVNATLIVRHEILLMERPSGLDEAHLFVIESRPEAGGPVPTGSVEADLATLRRMPDVLSATRINDLPLGDGGWRTAVAPLPITPGNLPHEHSAIFFTDDKGPETLGLRLVAGRGFTARDVTDMQTSTYRNHPTVAIVSRRLAEALFPGVDPVGQRIHSRIMGPLTVIGVVEHLQSAWPEWAMHEQSMLLPARFDWPVATYVVRVRGDAMPRAMNDATQRLLATNSRRLLSEPTPFEAVHANGYRDQRMLATLLTTLIAALLFLTVLGVVGTSSFWVASRTRQIGTRRALGATRSDIVRHFMAENLVTTAAGVAVGMLLAYGLNGWLIGHYSVPRLPWALPVLGGIALLALGQASALGPALRGSAVPPIVATKNL